MELENKIGSAESSSEASPSTHSSAQIRDEFKQCFDRYTRLLLHLRKSKCGVVVRGEINVQKVLEEYGRLKIWGIQTKTTVSTRESGIPTELDLLLSNEPEIRTSLLDILARMSRQLDLAIPIAQAVSDTDTNQSDRDSVNSSDSSSDYSSDSSSEGETDARYRTPSIKTLMSHIFEEIKLLYHIGSLLRRPELVGRYLKSSKGAPSTITELRDLQHVEEKVRQWRKEVSTGKYYTPKVEKSITEEHIQARSTEIDPESTIFVLSRRLAKANSQRREQFKYWEKHPYQEFSNDNLEHKKPIPPESQAFWRGDQLPMQDTASSAKVSEKKGTQSEKSIPTAHSFSVIHKSDIEEESPIVPRTIYAESHIAGRSSTKVPPVPNSPGVLFECPYCHMKLIRSVMEDRNNWKRHVFRDLRPYSCSFPDCSNPAKLFATRHDWIYHEMQMHRRTWNCHECDSVLPSKKLMVAHSRTAHQDTLTPSQLLVLVDMSERPIDEDKILPCPLCPSELYLNRLMEHLAGHMEELALFALPRNIDDAKDARSDIPTKTDPKGSRMSISWSNSNLGASEAEKEEKDDRYWLPSFTTNTTMKIEAILNQFDIEEKIIDEQLKLGYSDFGLPIPRKACPSILSPGQHVSFMNIQDKFLDNHFAIQPPDEWPGFHFNLGHYAISSETSFPIGLEYIGIIGKGNYSQVDEVRYSGTGEVFALKRIKRRENRKEELEEMKYVNGELNALRKIRKPIVQHFVKLVASYTDFQHIGMVLSPVADCNLGEFLDKFNDTGRRRQESLLGGFFGCLATALAYLHYSEKIRHEDIKPANILVKGNNIYLSDFGIALDWSDTEVTAIRDEVRKITKYCSPELYDLSPRNSKSDVWSLGCVFLEMIAVLKGKKRQYIYDELNSRGIGVLCRADNAIVRDIISMMGEDTSQYGNEPLAWIEKMLQFEAAKRPNSLELRDQILRAGQAHCGFCCFHIDVLKDD
ncbi:hypothetical protein F5X96DRAFT_42443 [Biscogniauxia mediterranea]|nr:hypothetical protein F5X96DRAFT_42443 [Biscogniauxia mediterranea]